MPRFIVKRTFANGLEMLTAERGREICEAVVSRNTALGVTWVHSYVSEDEHRTFCVCDAPTTDAIRATAAANDLPVDEITAVRVLDPYFYACTARATR
jgi:hypothetical protein